MNKTNRVLIQVFVATINIVFIYLAITLFLPQALEGEPYAIFFIALMFIIYFINIYSYIKYEVLKHPVPFPEEFLVIGEKLLIESSKHEIFTSISKIKTGWEILFITITNRRVIIAANNMGFWTYKHPSYSIWFKKDAEENKKKEYALEVKLNQTLNGIIVKRKIKIHDIRFENPEEIIKQIN